MASVSTEPRRASPSAQPLLHNFVTSDFDISAAKHLPCIDVRPLADGTDSDCDDHLRLPQTFWSRCLMAVRRRRPSIPQVDDFESVRLPTAEKKVRRFRWRKRNGAWACAAAAVFVVFFFGMVHIVNVALGYINPVVDDPLPRHWTNPNPSQADLANYLLDITRDVTPVPCHSHNDYWRQVPLYDALRWGCTGVEADVWLFDDDLFVGHSTYALTKDKTLRSMYVDPLVAMLDSKNTPSTISSLSSTSPRLNGVFDTSPNQTLILLIDFKNNGPAIFPYVSAHLSALRDRGYLTYYNGNTTVPGPVTVVATGNAPFDLVEANTTYRDIFFDAPLANMWLDPALSSSSPTELESPDDDVASALPAPSSGQGTVGTTPTSHFNATNSYYASVNFKAAIGRIWFGGLSAAQLRLMRGQIAGAHARGLKVRYWNTPSWPAALRNRVWRTLVDEGADMLNADALRDVAGGAWKEKGGRHEGWLG